MNNIKDLCDSLNITMKALSLKIGKSESFLCQRNGRGYKGEYSGGVLKMQAPDRKFDEYEIDLDEREREK